MKQKPIIFVIDGNWYLHRSFSTLKTNRPIEEALPYHFVSMVVKDALFVKARHLLVAFDGPKIFRYKVYPLYKHSRNNKKGRDQNDDDQKSKDIYEFLPAIFNLLDKVGIVYYQPRKYEADDVLCAVARQYAFGDRASSDVPAFRFIGGCRDKDANQYVQGPHIRLLDSSAKDKDGQPRPKFLDEAAITDATGLRPDQHADYQTLIGDKGDDIPKIPGFTPVRTKKILQKYGTLRRWYKKSRAARAELAPYLADLVRNRKLVTLVDEALPPGTPEDWVLPRTKVNDPFLTKNYHTYHLFLWPKSKGLFARRS
jgi:5'-3' exonuclease